MVSQVTKLINDQGFHMRPASLFANEMQKFKSDVFILYNGNEINGKSLMNILALGIKNGSTVEIKCSGEDENEALKEAIHLIESGLGE